MKTVLIIALLISSISVFAQKKSVPPDTIKLEMGSKELTILNEYQTKYNVIQQQMQQSAVPFQQRLEDLQKAFNDIVKVKVEASGGDADKYFVYDDKSHKVICIKKSKTD